jgi:hypothetical protein
VGYGIIGINTFHSKRISYIHILSSCQISGQVSGLKAYGAGAGYVHITGPEVQAVAGMMAGGGRVKN